MENSSYILESNIKNKVIRWGDDSMPLKIFIEQIVPGFNNDGEVYFNRLIKKAFSEWVDASGGKIRIEFVNNKKEAKLHINWVWKSMLQYKFDNVEGICKCFINFKNSRLHKAIIDIYIPQDKPITDVKEFYSVVLHELGHSLGLLDHSLNRDDIMYKEATAQQTLSIRDKNTIKLLYSLPLGTLNQDISEKILMNRDNIFTSYPI